MYMPSLLNNCSNVSKVLVLGFTVLFGYASATYSSKTEATTLVGTTWVIETLFNHPTGNHVFLKLNEDGKLTGFAGCNRFFANYILDQDKLKFGLVGSTKMMCPDMATETQLFKAVDQTEYYKLARNRLILFNESMQVVAEGLAQSEKD